MFKRKKIMALCATTLAGISALGSFAPMAAFADVTKSGDTVVTYEGAPKPADWGLSVPATLKLDKKLEKWTYNNAKIAIVNSTGEEYSGDSNIKFNISGTSSVLNGNKVGLTNNSATNKYIIPLNMTVTNQGEEEPVDVPTSRSQLLNTLQNIEIDSSKGNLYKFVQFAVWDDDLTDKNQNLTNTISWTAAEKTS